jgi:Skp family chaperone for outer membrane proteins
MRRVLLILPLFILSQAVAGEKKERVTVDVTPLTPPKVLVKEDEYLKELERLKKKLALMELKAKIAEYESKIAKLEREKVPVSLPLRPKRDEEREEREEKKENPYVAKYYKLQEELLRRRLEREKVREFMSRVEKVQRFFTGIIVVGGKKVAVDSLGNQYREGSTVYGMQVVRIDSEGVTLFDPITKSTFSVSISSALSGGKGGREESLSPSQEAPQGIPEEPPMELPPPPLGG